MKISCTLGSKGSWGDHGLPTIGKAGDILELVDYPDKGMSKQYICASRTSFNDAGYVSCDICEIDHIGIGNDLVCMYMKCRCACGKNRTYLASIDNIMENL